jgi:hypothetical protein
MMNAAITAGTLMNRKNWSTESIVVIPQKDRTAPPARAYSTPRATC